MEFILVAILPLFSTICHVFALQPTGREVCLQQMDEGPCRGNVGRFYYNTITQKCEEFSYGGCQGNANNFITFEECQKTCWRIPKVPQICRFTKEVGPCRAMHLRYHYNMTSMQCEPFFYGGCQGNDNRFSDQQSCMDYCRPHKRTSVLCRDPLDKGRCAASIPRYYYNTATRMCEQFMYSGCGGSSNNFVSRQGCLDVCGKGNRLWKNKHRGNRTMKRKPINFVLY